MSAGPSLDELRVGDAPELWRALGFDVGADSTCLLGRIRLRLGAGEGRGITSWALRSMPDGSLDGLATTGSRASEPELVAVDPPRHANGALAVDHVVAATPDLDRTLAVLASAGLEPRRRRDAGGTARQAFYVLGDALLEVVGPRVADGDGRAVFWGLAVVVDDLDRLAERLGPLLGTPRPAVQPGRLIATVRGKEAGLGTALAFMTPRGRS